ncbi:FAD:protein FMN transferase [Agaribacterium sp. ZY112]|uniref:FAD:protein FMN transferase n=1 Tax=Agaribacterium sp. ZY112 TaxID=3233574 RepID=UPI0035255649
MGFSVSSLQKGLVLPALFCCVIGLLACSEQPEFELWQLQGQTMGTTYHAKLVVKPEVDLEQEQLQQQLDALLVEINQSMSTYISDSELSRFNRAAVGEPFTVSTGLCEVLSDAGEIYHSSNRAFDPTVGPLVNLWGFGPEDRSAVPSAAERQSAMNQIGFDALGIHCDESYILKNKALYVDLSAIAKGWAVDKLAQHFDSLGLVDYMVEIGGELRLSGVNGRSSNWRIAVEKPILGQGSAAQVLSLTDVAVATSGDYRNYIERDGERFSHTLNPQTGMPITHKLASVTVVTETCSKADAWATALNVIGPDAGFELAEKEGLAAYFIVREGDDFGVRYTQAFEQYMVKL